VGSVRPAVFRSSTYVFSSPEAAERAFNVVSGRQPAEPGEQVELIYSRFNHPPWSPARRLRRSFNSGMAAILTSILTFALPEDSLVYTTPLYGGTQHFIHEFLEPWGIHCIAVPAGRTARLEEAILAADRLSTILIETPANPTMMMTDIRHAVEAASGRPDRPLVMVDNTFLAPASQHPLRHGAVGVQRQDRRRGDRTRRTGHREDPRQTRHPRQHSAARRVLAVDSRLRTFGFA
jgi:cystathionine beta-lyase/cystathionine gamma-synthase